jgi:hypothetical protein
MPYIDLNIETDPEALKDEAVAYIEDAFPGWEAAAGNLETILLEVIAEMAAEQATVAAEMPAAVFRRFGQALVGLDPIEGVEAIGSTTWTMTDALGHTITAGTAVEIEGQVFETTVETTVPVGVSTASIPVEAVEVGAQGNGLTGDAVLVDTIAYVDSVAVVGTTSGGVDAETDEEYLDRLVDELQLMAPRPIVPTDFEVMARRIAGVDRAVALDGWDAASSASRSGQVTNASKSVTSITGGTVTSDMIGAAISGPNIPAGTFVATVPTSSSLTMTKAATGTNGGNALTILGASGVERTIAIAAVDEDGEAVSAGTKTDIEDFLEARREVNFVVDAIDPTYTTVNITTTVTLLPDFDATIVLDNVEAAITDFLQPYNFGRVFTGSDNVSRPWVNTRRLGYLNVAEVIRAVPGVAFIETLSMNDGTGAVSADIVLGGAAPLTRPGVITAT